MKSNTFTRWLSSTYAAVPLAFIARCGVLLKDAGVQLGSTMKWLFGSREHTNFTYRLSDRNLEEMAWFVSNLCSIPIEEAEGYIHELLADAELVQHLKFARRNSPRHRIMSDSFLPGRRAAWYAIVRASRPGVVVETGTDKGSGSIIIATALRRNGYGKLMTIDVNPTAGSLISGSYASVVEQFQRSSLDQLASLHEQVDFFLHDSDHDPEFEMAEYLAVSHWLTPDALVLSDNCERSSALSDWSRTEGRCVIFFREEGHPRWLARGMLGV